MYHSSKPYVRQGDRKQHKNRKGKLRGTDQRRRAVGRVIGDVVSAAEMRNGSRTGLALGRLLRI